MNMESKLDKELSLYLKLMSEDDNYIVFRDGKAIKQNIKDSDSLDFCVDDQMDPYDICFRKRPKEENDILNKSKFSTFLDIRKDIDLKLIYINDFEENLSFSFEIERDLNVSIINILISNKANSNILFDYNLNDKANLKLMNFVSSKDRANIYNNYYLDDRAHIDLDSMTLGDKELNVTSNAYLYQNKASIDINNCIINNSTLPQVNNFVIYHENTYTISKMKAYGLCDNDSELSINTNAYIKNKAKGSDASQKTKGIILDKYSKVNASPLLQIDEYDCLASHGASIGAISDQDIFYLMSRGLKENEARALIVHGFFNQYLSNIEKDSKIYSFIEDKVSSHLKKI